MCPMGKHTTNCLYDQLADGAAIDVSLPSFVEPGDLHSYHLTNKGIHVAKSIVCIVGHTHPDVTFSPTIFAVTSLFLHYLGEEDTYDCVSSLLSSGQGHITQTKKAYEASRYILRDLAKKFAVCLNIKLFLFGRVPQW